ncbi:MULTISPECIES: hypothetical protein [unclassified Streptomyces]|uniref:hypothetical protein n=1 Tax=unclassified Streptomyces TaxID=2593676 RepID=UPI002E175FF1
MAEFAEEHGIVVLAPLCPAGLGDDPDDHSTRGWTPHIPAGAAVALVAGIVLLCLAAWRRTSTSCRVRRRA